MCFIEQSWPCRILIHDIIKSDKPLLLLRSVKREEVMKQLPNLALRLCDVKMVEVKKQLKAVQRPLEPNPDDEGR